MSLPRTFRPKLTLTAKRIHYSAAHLDTRFLALTLRTGLGPSTSITSSRSSTRGRVPAAVEGSGGGPVVSFYTLTNRKMDELMALRCSDSVTTPGRGSLPVCFLVICERQLSTSNSLCLK